MLAVKFKIQNSRFVEQKLFHLFQFCVLAHYISLYLNQIEFVSMQKSLSKTNAKYVNEYFISDIIYYLCNLLLNIEHQPTSFNLAVANYFLKFSQSTLPKYADIYKTLLNYIISVFSPLVQKYSNTKLAISLLSCMKFLICDHKTMLKDAIALLDCFPNEEIFEEFKQIHIEIKYNDHQFNLAEEIDYFLKVDERKVEGYIGLREHVKKKLNNFWFLFFILTKIYIFIFIISSYHRKRKI